MHPRDIRAHAITLFRAELHRIREKAKAEELYVFAREDADQAVCALLEAIGLEAEARAFTEFCDVLTEIY